MNAGVETTYVKTMNCPVHDCGGGGGGGGTRSRPTAYSLCRRKSYDEHVRSSVHGKPGTLKREKPIDVRAFEKKPFHHSHSVTCAIPAASQAAAEGKAKSVGNLTGSMRPRPNFLDLCPNQNASFNAYRRRYSRSSERSFDFEDCSCPHDYGQTYSRMRYSRRSSSRDSGKAFDILCRQEVEENSGRVTTIRKGMSLLSLCAGKDDSDDEDDHRRSTKIYRPPTRHFYHKGMSGLPVKCPAKYMGLAY